MASTNWLSEKGFRHADNWSSPQSRVHGAAWLRRASGIYAFVVDDTVVYIGKADALHRRLRNYSRRSFAIVQTKVPRRVHQGIAEEVERGRVVAVYALTVRLDAPWTAKDLERELISQAQPLWNVQGKAAASHVE